MEVYLDNAATTKAAPEVVAAVVECMQENYGNPSSAHRLGVAAERVLKKTRETLAAYLKVSPEEIVFTSGGTEANNLGLRGVLPFLRRFGRHIVTSSYEHPSVDKVMQALQQEGWEVTFIPGNREGSVKEEELLAVLRPDTVLVSIMHVNNETGAINDVVSLGELVKQRAPRALFHVDAVQSFGRVPVDIEKGKIDLLSLSGHKIHGPKGIGALYVRRGVKLKPLLLGGGQERDLRSGTENVPAIAGLGRAVELLNKESVGRMMALKLKLAEGIKAICPEAEVNGPPPAAGAPHILNISFPGFRGEVLLHALEEKGIYVSTGSACSSRKEVVSRVLKNMGLPRDLLYGAIRFSFSPYNTEAEIDYVLERLQEVVKELALFRRR